MDDIHTLATRTSDEEKESDVIKIMGKAFLEPTNERKHEIYRTIRAHTPAYKEHNYTYSMAELEEDLEQTYLAAHLGYWMEQDPDTRPPMPLGLVSRGEKFAKHFQETERKCNLRKGIKG